MASVGRYQGSVAFSASDLRRHFETSDELDIGGEARLSLIGLDRETLDTHHSSALASLENTKEEDWPNLMLKQIKMVVDRILLPLGKVLKSVATDGSLLIEGDERVSGELNLFSSDKRLKLGVHRGDVITKTAYLAKTLLDQKQIVLQPNQWLVLSDVPGAPIIAANPNPGKEFTFNTKSLLPNFKIEGDNIAIAKDATTKGFAVSSTTSNLIVKLAEDS